MGDDVVTVVVVSAVMTVVLTGRKKWKFAKEENEKKERA